LGALHGHLFIAKCCVRVIFCTVYFCSYQSSNR